ncbi:MAG: hypothetical protein JSU87_03810 [Gemmatimonadota bacterium]|nr:MAG: hypothetical protein JSU87_03810 [Gemmatimonadota bacterium]
MAPEIIELLAPFLALVGVGGATLLGMKMRYTHIQRTRLGGVAQQDVERLSDAVDTLSAQVGLLRDQFLELNERVEFTERLLERPRSEG